ncbi:MAG: glycosyltransferase [Armatimonadetes bacterium]|nr:glycosyltransferase [Armatimonadota bacterium]
MSEPDLRFSVVIPTYNRRETLAVVLPSLRDQTFPSSRYELLLCDAGSTDGTRELIESLAIANLRWLPGADRGRAGARNRGIENARGEIILFTDADIIADPELLSQHDRYHVAHPGDAVVGCEIQVNNLAEHEEYRRAPERHARHRATRRFLPWHYFLTGNASVDRKALIEVEMFDEGFTGYGHEDLELGYRLVRRGLKIRYSPGAINYHWHPVPFAEQCRKQRLAGHSLVRFYRKHRDLQVALRMGLNPLSLALHSLLPEDGPVFRWLLRQACNLRFLRPLLLEHYHVSGMKEALSGAPPRT